MILMLCGRICLSLYRIPIIREHLLVLLSDFFSNSNLSQVLIQGIEMVRLFFIQGVFELFILGIGGFIALCLR